MNHISQPVLDGMVELVNIGVGRSAGSLNTLTGHHVSLRVPEIKICTVRELKKELPRPDLPFTVINQDYSGAFDGTAMLMFPQESAEGLFLLMTGEEKKTQTNDELWQMTLTEIANIIVNAVMGSITNILGKKIEFHIPEYHEDSLDHILADSRFLTEEQVAVVHTVFEVREKDISGKIAILLTKRSIETIAEFIHEKMG
jgi:chemotaxis protein CheC